MRQLASLLVVLAIALPAATSGAQSSSPKRKASRTVRAERDSSKLRRKLPADTVSGRSAATAAHVQAIAAAPVAKKTSVTKTAERWSRFSVTTFARSIYDSNIRHDKNNLAAYGLIGGGATRYQSRRMRAPLTATYTVAKHSYSEGAEWNRVSQDLNVVATRRLTPHLTFETIGEIALKGSSEDRDIGDQYIFLPRLSYRVSPSQRLRGYGAYRIKRYDLAPDRNAYNRYGGLEFRQDVGNAGQWELGYRYETNSARSERQSYVRRTYATQYAASLRGENQIVGVMKYRAQRYDKRPVLVGSVYRPRMDQRFEPSIEFLHPLSEKILLDVSYEFERRTSNDPNRGYRDHLASISARYRW